jgi:hypothetical protein
MITKQKTYMIASIFFLAVAMVIYTYNGIIIPNKLKTCTNDIYAEMRKGYSEVYAIAQAGVAGGIYIDGSNYSDHLIQSGIYSEKKLSAVTYRDIEKGFYIGRDMAENEILTLSDIRYDAAEKNCSLYEIKTCNSFCGDLKPGETVDLIYLLGNRVMIIAERKQLKGIYGYNGERRAGDGRIDVGPEAIIFLELTKEEYEEYLSNENVYVRKTGDIFGD